MIKLILENYKTYFNTATGRPERHWGRLFIFLILSLICSIFAPDEISDVYSMMATGVTVLTGFTFTALFSDHALPSFGLPHPKTENDRQDLVRLNALSNNFRARSSYFITLSVLEIVLLAAASLNFLMPSNIKNWLTICDFVVCGYTNTLLPIFQNQISFIFSILSVIVIIIYLECLYTFYRLAETILSILNIRQAYIRQ